MPSYLALKDDDCRLKKLITHYESKLHNKIIPAKVLALRVTQKNRWIKKHRHGPWNKNKCNNQVTSHTLNISQWIHTKFMSFEEIFPEIMKQNSPRRFRTLGIAQQSSGYFFLRIIVELILFRLEYKWV